MSAFLSLLGAPPPHKGDGDRMGFVLEFCYVRFLPHLRDYAPRRLL